jgi:NAD-dependent dihydropyrimidine dehydrogenase PreA subunit
MGLRESLGLGRKGGEAKASPGRPTPAPAPAHAVHGGVSWAPRIDAGACRGCGTCLDECPTGVFHMGRHDKGARVARPQDCRATCELCASRCPEGGISFPDR